MLAARAAWVAARIPYMQTEAFRFGNKIVDDWEGKVNSWPLDEGLIDYVVRLLRHRSVRERALRRRRHRQHLADYRRQKLDTSKITKELLAERCRRPAASKPMSPPAITPSSSCSGART